MRGVFDVPPMSEKDGGGSPLYACSNSGSEGRFDMMAEG